ncbi:uncharacterized protein MELLADRAFT_62382 [Melampsora larici-populina 98AG31]|uniref:RING-type domain-containing protein n=1 Tax=Melampsora larici-populina (strain 98AG31 / pathotype 3-4-7) TaxID=747676 RepID=F4RIS4_MELLP|nr:uncharacterized protein MELLADRAFT_62382 [Melampsora larici-populina 98AG31]EGG07780.1 hypothetical protein MELLADRAFT_62382 [Melampsora larici-populina 98AG31]
MNKVMLSWGWYLMISFSLCVFTPTERRIGGVIEDDDLVGHQVAQRNQIHHSTRLTPPPRTELDLDNVGTNDVTSHYYCCTEPMREKIKELENIVPLNEGFEYKTDNSRSLLTKIRDLATQAIALWRGLNEIPNLCDSAKRYPSSISSMGIELENVMIEARGGRRIGTLSVERVKGVMNGKIQIFPVDEAVTEALKRVELIVTIKNYLLKIERNLQTPELIKIHDKLLQNRSLTKAGIIESLASQSVHHTFLENTPDGEIECYSRIMQHLELFYPVTTKFAITEGLKQVQLIKKIRNYLQDSDRNPQTHAIKTKYNKLLQTKSMDDVVIVRSLVLESLQHMDINNPDEDVECLYDILQYLETLHPNSEPFRITEPLGRVQLIMNIRNYLHKAERSLQTTAILNIHNTLLQTSSLDKPEIAKLLASQCMDHMVLDNAPHEEIQCLDHILKYLEKFYPITVPLIKSRLSSNEPFRKIHQKFKSQAELQHHVKRYSEKEDKDPYIMSLLLPFIDVGWDSLDSSYVEHCLHILNIQDTALASNKGDLYGLDDTKVKKYHEDQDFFIEMMYKASVYIKGIKEYLNTQVPKDEQSGHCKFISSVFLGNEIESSEKCNICLSGYLQGQRVIKLGCQRPHVFHEQCINSSYLKVGMSDVPHVYGDYLYHFLKRSTFSGGNLKLTTLVHNPGVHIATVNPTA